MTSHPGITGKVVIMCAARGRETAEWTLDEFPVLFEKDRESIVIQLCCRLECDTSDDVHISTDIPFKTESFYWSTLDSVTNKLNSLALAGTSPRHRPRFHRTVR